MKEFHFNHLKAFFPFIVSIAVIVLGYALINKGIHYDSKVLIDTNGILFNLAGLIFVIYGIIETRLIWIASNLAPTKLVIEKDKLVVFEKNKAIKIDIDKIKMVTFCEREFGRRTISNDIEYSKIETYKQGTFLITSFIISPQKLNNSLNIPSSKKLFIENKSLKKIS